jgi:hypothetical protein
MGVLAERLQLDLTAINRPHQRGKMTSIAKGIANWYHIDAKP